MRARDIMSDNIVCIDVKESVSDAGVRQVKNHLRTMPASVSMGA